MFLRKIARTDRGVGLFGGLGCYGFLCGWFRCARGGEEKGGRDQAGMGVQGGFGQLLSTFIIGVEAAGELFLGWGGVWVRIETARLELGGWMDRL